MPAAYGPTWRTTPHGGITLNEQIRLGRIAGIPIGANWSVLVVLWLIAWSLATVTLPDGHPGQATMAYWIVGAIAAVVFMASLLAHEIGHSLVAKRHGLDVVRITLWIFGGVASLRGGAPTPAVELKVAAAGPAVSVALGAAFVSGGFAADRFGAPVLVGAALSWLGTINIVLAVFNLIPAAPLDGGRILRAALWARHGDRLRATVQAVNAGRAFGYLLVGLGVVQFAAGGGVGGLWFVFLGWFVLNAANAEASDALLRESLKGVSVGEVMTPDPVTAPDHIVASELLDRYVMVHRASAFPLLAADGSLTGLVTLARLKSLPTEQRAATPALAIACPAAEVATARPDEELVALLDRMASSPEHRAVVLRDGRVVGIVTPTDVTRTIQLVALRRG